MEVVLEVKADADIAVAMSAEVAWCKRKMRQRNGSE
jgi:hypothetical protein